MVALIGSWAMVPLLLSLGGVSVPFDPSPPSPPRINLPGIDLIACRAESAVSTSASSRRSRSEPPSSPPPMSVASAAIAGAAARMAGGAVNAR